MEGRPGVFEGGEEDHLHPLVELFDDRDEVLARLRQVGQLFREELVPLLERRELLEGERVHAAELGELPLSVLQPSALLCAVVGNGCRRLGVHRRQMRRRREPADPVHIPK